MDVCGSLQGKKGAGRRGWKELLNDKCKMMNAKCKSGRGDGQEHEWNSGLRVEPGTWHLALGTDIRGQKSVPIAIGSKISADAGGPLQGIWGREGEGWKVFLNDICKMSNDKCKSGKRCGQEHGWNSGLRVEPGTWHSAPGTRHSALGTWHSAHGTWHRY